LKAFWGTSFKLYALFLITACLELGVQICSSASLAIPPAYLPAIDAHTQAVSVSQIPNAA
jgi:hypothetical protein